MIGNNPWNKGKELGPQSPKVVSKRRESLMGHVISQKTRDKIKSAVSCPVIQIDTNGIKVKEWESLKQVSKQLPCSHGRLSEYINGKSNISTFNGFIWKLKKTA